MDITWEFNPNTPELEPGEFEGEFAIYRDVHLTYMPSTAQNHATVHAASELGTEREENCTLETRDLVAYELVRSITNYEERVDKIQQGNEVSISVAKKFPDGTPLYYQFWREGDDPRFPLEGVAQAYPVTNGGPVPLLILDGCGHGIFVREFEAKGGGYEAHFWGHEDHGFGTIRLFGVIDP